MKFAPVLSIVLLSQFRDSLCRPTVLLYIHKLPELNLTQLVIEDPATVTAKWDPVQDDGNIQGYKLYLWEPEMIEVYNYETDDLGEKKLTAQFKEVNRPLSEVPHSKPAIITVGPKDTQASYEDLKPETEYQLRVRAFDKNGDGPYSNALSVKFVP